jgi:hypothetical protein
METSQPLGPAARSHYAARGAPALRAAGERSQPLSGAHFTRPRCMHACVVRGDAHTTVHAGAARRADEFMGAAPPRAAHGTLPRQWPSGGRDRLGSPNTSTLSLRDTGRGASPPPLHRDRSRPLTACAGLGRTPSHALAPEGDRALHSFTPGRIAPALAASRSPVASGPPSRPPLIHPRCAARHPHLRACPRSLSLLCALQAGILPHTASRPPARRRRRTSGPARPPATLRAISAAGTCSPRCRTATRARILLLPVSSRVRCTLRTPGAPGQGESWRAPGTRCEIPKRATPRAVVSAAARIVS